MTGGGWLFMSCSMAFVLGLTTYCFYNVLKLPREDIETHIKAQPGIDTGDLDDAD